MAKQILAQITSFVGTDANGLTAVNVKIGFGETSDTTVGTRNVTEAFLNIDDEANENDEKGIATIKGLIYFLKAQEQAAAMRNDSMPKIDVSLPNDIYVKATSILFAAKDEKCDNPIAYLESKNMLTYANSDEYKEAYVNLFETLRSCDTIRPVLHFSRTRSLFNWHFEPMDKNALKNLPKDGETVKVLNGVIAGTNLKCFDNTKLGGDDPKKATEVVLTIKTIKTGANRNDKLVITTPRKLTIIEKDGETEITASEANKRLAAGEKLVGKTGSHCKLIARLQLNLDLATSVLNAKGFTPKFLGFDMTKPANYSTFSLN